MTLQAKRRIDYWLGGFLLLLLFPLARLLGLLLRRDHLLARRRGCVVIKLIGAGSLFLAMPSMQAIRAQFPPGCFYLAGTRAVTGLAASYDWFDACWTIDDSSLPRLIFSTLRVLWNVARHADHVIDLEVHSRLTTVFSLLTMVRNRIGFVDEIVFWRRGLYTHMTWFNTHGPSYAFYDLLAQWFGIEQVPVAGFYELVPSVCAGGAAAQQPDPAGTLCRDRARLLRLCPGTAVAAAGMGASATAAVADGLRFRVPRRPRGCRAG